MFSVRFEKFGGYRLILVLVAVAFLASVSVGQTLSGWGTATIDGVLSGGGPAVDPLSPVAIASLKAEVDARILDGTLKAKDAKLLVRSLEDALKRIDQGKLKQAEDEIEKFLKEVKKLVKKGDLSSTLGDAWTAAANNIISPPAGGGEWASAGTTSFTLNLPEGQVTATLYVMNDADNLYMALAFPQSVFNEFDLSAFRMEFNNNNDVVVLAQDGFFVDGSTAPAGACGPGFDVFCIDFGSPEDIDGSGAFIHDGTTSVYEMSHPWNSGKPLDIALSFGDVVEYRLGHFLFAFPAIETWYPSLTTYGTIKIASAPSAFLTDGTQERIGKLAEAEVASEFTLGPNYPNPFNPSTTITYDLQTSSDVTLKVFNMLGQEVATLVDRYQSAGKYSVSFEAHSLPSGLYVYQLRAGSKISNRTMVLVK